ncbi:MAG: hypothetical protein E4H20_06675, partial [Spirochaetales bacterium]
MRNVLAGILACVVATSVYAQTPIQDGTIQKGEYSITDTQSGITIAASLSKDGSTLYMAVSAATAGWVSFGVGSPRMNGSYMIFGFQKSDGVRVISEETGKGHSHSPNNKSMATAFITEMNGVTTLEAAFPATGFIKAGILDVIAAMGKR